MQKCTAIQADILDDGSPGIEAAALWFSASGLSLSRKE